MMIFLFYMEGGYAFFSVFFSITKYNVYLCTKLENFQ